jgi:hypothetical protein
MFGLGKKKSTPEASEEKDSMKKAQQKTVATASISDDKFVVMPEQYMPQKGSAPTRKVNKKVLILGGSGALVLIVLAVTLYVVFSSSDSIAPEITSTPTQPVSQPPATISSTTRQEEALETTKGKVVTAQAYTETNVLAGTLSMNISPLVAEAFGAGLGITVLEPTDLTLPEEGTVVGGLYSTYPTSITFEEAVSFEMIVASFPEGVSIRDTYPAYLRGVRWQELSDYQLSSAGFIFSLEKLPSGPIAVIWNNVAPLESGKLSGVLQPISDTDTDADGLTDKEEQLFGTSITSADSDSDTYLDLEEINNGYSPVAPLESLVEGELFSTYTNPTYGYRAPYPVSWLADSLDQTNKQVLFISDTEEFFEILIEENPLNTPIVDWYRGQSPTLANISLDITLVANRPAVWSPDGLTLYTAKDGLIYIITYNNGTRDTVSWPNVFKYFYTNFSFGDTVSQDSGDSNGEGSELNSGSEE